MYHDETEKFFMCGCYSHALMVSADDNPNEDDPCCYLNMWYCGPNNTASFWQRLKWAWAELFHGDYGPNEIVFDRQQVHELIEHLQNLERTMERKK